MKASLAARLANGVFAKPGARTVSALASDCFVTCAGAGGGVGAAVVAGAGAAVVAGTGAGAAVVAGTGTGAGAAVVAGTGAGAAVVAGAGAGAGVFDFGHNFQPAAVALTSDVHATVPLATVPSGG
jgi:hypothetical protein